MGRKVKKKLQNKTEKEKKVKKRKSVEDIEEILEKIEKQQLAQVEVSVSAVLIPSRRAGASFSTSTLNSDEIVMFGGEWYDGQKVWMYNDHFVYNTEKNSWSKISSPTQPGPRSSHQTVCTNNGYLFLFGGEFVSPNETNFFHYKDFWMLDLSKNSWEKLNIKGGPSPRSGHRMVLWKHLIVLFGGFFDQVHDTKYLQDLWVFDTLNFKWFEINCNDPKPSARSGFQFFTHQDKIILLGGYSQTKLKGKKSIGMMHSDSWALRMNTELGAIKWEKLRKPGGIPPQQRTGSTTVYHKGKGIMFGGVSDIVEEEETIESVIHQDSYQYNIDTNKFFPLNMKAKEEVDIPSPGPRFNPMMAVSKNVLFMYGGILEIGQKEFTRCDLWTLNLDKLIQWTCVVADETVESAWKGTDYSSDEEESDDSDSQGDENEEEESIDDQENLESEESEDTNSKVEQGVALDPLSNPDDEPRPFEKLHEYGTRTSILWQEKAMEVSSLTGKPLRRLAFRFAEHHFHARRPENSKIEEHMASNEVEEANAKTKKADSEARSRNR